MIISAAVQSRRGDQFLVDPLRSWEEVAGVEVAGVEVVRISGKEQHHFSWIALEAGKRVAVNTIQGMEGPLVFPFVQSSDQSVVALSLIQEWTLDKLLIKGCMEKMPQSKTLLVSSPLLRGSQ